MRLVEDVVLQRLRATVPRAALRRACKTLSRPRAIELTGWQRMVITEFAYAYPESMNIENLFGRLAWRVAAPLSPPMPPASRCRTTAGELVGLGFLEIGESSGRWRITAEGIDAVCSYAESMESKKTASRAINRR